MRPFAGLLHSAGGPFLRRITTEALFRAYELNPDAPQTPVPMSVTADLKSVDPRTEVPIFYLHGTLFGDNPSEVVITQNDYARFQSKRAMLWQRLKAEFATSTILYVGYSNRDPNWQLVLNELTQEFYPSRLPLSYRLDPYAEEIDIEILRDSHIETLVMDLPKLQALVKAAIGDFKPDPDWLNKFRKDVPHDLIPAFESNPASVLRLLDSWAYVNAANFHEAPNTSQFLKGDKPNWALVGSGINFKRDIEDDLWNDMLEFATEPKAKSRALAAIASAGFGVTTLIMSLASRAVRDKVGKTFMLRPAADVIEADVAFAVSVFPKDAVIFVIDQAREQVNRISTAISQQVQSGGNCLFLLGERKNEWRMARMRGRVREFEIIALSDSEIDRLLDLLTREHALGRLGDLDRSMQFAVVKEKHEKQLLVAMREAIEDAHFDAIIEDEYRGIQDRKDPVKSGASGSIPPRGLLLSTRRIHTGRSRREGTRTSDHSDVRGTGRLP